MYIGHYNDGTGYGNMASNYIECLVGQGIDVVSIPLIFGPNKIEPSDIIKKTEKKKLSGIDMVIIHTLPKFYHNHPSLPTIGIFSSEMSGIPKTWVNKINQLSASIVSSKQSQLACIGSGAKSPFVLPYAFNMENYQKSYDHIKITKRLKNEGKTIFYTIGEFINRKNFSALLRAYYTEFTKQDNVHLIIKSGLGNHTPEQVAQLFERKNAEIINGLNIRVENMPEVTFSPVFLTQDQIYSLHYNSDIYVSASFGESWCALKGTPVNVDNNLKNIEDVLIGDKVITHKGKLKNITNILQRNYNGKIYSIKCLGFSEKMNFTENHRHYILKQNAKNPDFIETQNIKIGDLWAVPKIKNEKLENNFIKISDFIKTDVINGKIECSKNYKNKESRTINNEIELTENFMFFLGHYIAEGDNFVLCTHKNEDYGRNISYQAIKLAFNLQPKERLVRENCIVSSFHNKKVVEFLNVLCGKGSKNKYINKILKQNINIKNLISGIFYGDGYFSEKRKEISFSTCSKQLANNIKEVCNSYGVYLHMRKNVRKNGNICYELFVCSKHRNLFIETFKPYKYNKKIELLKEESKISILEDENNFYIPIKKIESFDYSGQVYNISVEEDESYTTNGFATHNCVPTYEAMAFGKTPVIPESTGYLEYISNKEGYLVKTHELPCFGLIDGDPELYNSHFNYYSVDINDLKLKMRKSLTRDKNKSIAGMEKAHLFSYDNVGKLFRKVLENVQEVQALEGSSRGIL